MKDRIGFIGFTILICVLAGGIVHFWGQTLALKDEIRDLRQEREKISWKVGWSEGFGSYNLVTMDGGKNWHATEKAPSGEVKILGPAEKFHPGLLKHLAGWDALVEHVEKNGSIGSRGSITEKDIEALRGAGFEVKPKTAEAK